MNRAFYPKFNSDNIPEEHKKLTIVEQYSAIESGIRSALAEGPQNFHTLVDKLQFPDLMISETIAELKMRDFIQNVRGSSDTYELSPPIVGEAIFLDGETMLPTTVIYMEDKTLVSRGKWYEFPKDFDVRRIVWNVQLRPCDESSTLLNLLKAAIDKEKRVTVKHNPKYDMLKNKVIPYSENIGILLRSIGDDISDVSLIFKIQVGGSSTDKDSIVPIYVHRGFTVRTKIDTQSMLDELHKPVAERNYIKGINLNRIFKVSDFIFNGQEIPLNFTKDEHKQQLTYARLETASKDSSACIKYYLVDSNGDKKLLDSEKYEADDFILKVEELFEGFANVMLSNLNFLIED